MKNFTPLVRRSFSESGTLLLCILLSTSLRAQAPVFNWASCFGGFLYERSNCVIQSYDGKYWMAGKASSTDGDVSVHKGGNDFWSAKASSTGALISQYSYGGASDDIAESLVESSDSNRVIFGTTSSTDQDVKGNHGYSDFWLVKANKKNGKLMWKKCFGGRSTDVGHQMAEGTAGDVYYCVGTTNSKNKDVVGKHKLTDAWLIKVDYLGTLVWQLCLGTNGNDEGWAVAATSDGGCVVAGIAGASGLDAIGYHGGKDFFIAKVSSGGTKEWSKCYGGTNDEAAYAIKPTADGGYVATGYTRSTDGDASGLHGGSGEDIWVIKTDATGGLLWQHCYGGSSGYEEGQDILQTADDGFLIASSIDTYAASLIGADYTSYKGYEDAWLMKTNAAGVLEWNGTYGGGSNDEPRSIIINAAGEYVIAGYSGSSECNVGTQHGNEDFWLLNLGAVDCGVPMGMSATSMFGYATMKWCAMPAAISYELDVRPVGDTFTVYSMANGNDVSKAISVSPSTTYEWKVRTICSTDTSGFCTLQSFTTPARMSEASTDFIYMKLFPNPAHDQLQMQISGAGDETAALIVYDLNGRAMLSQPVLLHDGNATLTLDVSSLPAGMYVMEVKGKDFSERGRFVKE